MSLVDNCLIIDFSLAKNLWTMNTSLRTKKCSTITFFWFCLLFVSSRFHRCVGNWRIRRFWARRRRRRRRRGRRLAKLAVADNFLIGATLCKWSLAKNLFEIGRLKLVTIKQALSKTLQLVTFAIKQRVNALAIIVLFWSCQKKEK